jgi:ABC-2 type transport system ATP-binding protein
MVFAAFHQRKTVETVRTENLSKRVAEIFQLGPLDFRLRAGEIFVVLGPEGSGKTTLLRLVWGFMRPDFGRIFVFGMYPHLNQMDVRRRAGYVSKHPQLQCALTARQFLRFVGNFYDGWEERYACRVLEEFGVHPDLKIETLSKTERFKVGLVSAVGHRPALLILDEPTWGLDRQFRPQALRFIETLAREQQVSILISSDDPNDLAGIADTVLTLNNGRPVGQRTVHFRQQS